MVLPKHYYSNLSNKDRSKQLKELNKSRKLYKKGIFHTRKKMPSFKGKKSRHVVEFEKKYCTNITDLKSVSKKTGVPVNILKKVVSKGMGAYYSSGSRPNQTPHSWGYARLGSVLLKHNAYNIDKHLFLKNNKYIEIKQPNKKMCNKKNNNNNDNNKKIVSCCEIEDKFTKYRKCKGKNEKIYDLPRRFNKTQCKNIRGFTMRSSCAIYKNC